MNFIIVAVLALFSLALQAETLPTTKDKEKQIEKAIQDIKPLGTGAGLDALDDKNRLFKSDDREVFAKAAEAIGLKPFKFFEDKKEFTLNDFKRELHARLEFENTALDLEKGKSDLIQMALKGAKTSADVTAKVKAFDDSATKKIEAHFAAHEKKLTDAFNEFKLKSLGDIKALDPKMHFGLIKSIQDTVIERTKAHEAELQVVRDAKAARLKQSKDFFDGLMKQIEEVIKSKDPKAVVAEWNKQREALEQRVKALTDAELLLLKKEVEMLKYAKQMSAAVRKFREVEFDQTRAEWLKKFDESLSDVVTKKYTTDFFTKDAGQWGFLTDMGRRFETLKKGEPFLEQYKAIKDKENEGTKPSGGRKPGGNSGGTRRPPGGTH